MKVLEREDNNFLYLFLVLIIGTLIGVLSISFFGINPFTVISIIFKGLFSKIGINNILVFMAPCIMCSLGFLVAYKSGVFNMGVQGQYVIGAILTSIWGAKVDLPAPINIFLALLIGAAGGAIWTLPAAILKSKRNVSEIITTMLLSFVAPYVGLYLAGLPEIADPTRINVVATLPVNSSASFPSIFKGTEINISLIASIVFALIVYLFIWKTRVGLRARATGLNSIAARYAGINISKITNLTFILSGALAGLGGSFYILGVSHAYYARTFIGFSGYGMTGIIAAFLGGMNPLGIIFSSLFFAILTTAGLFINVNTDIPVDYITFIEGIILAFVCVPWIMKSIVKKIIKVRG